MSMINITGRVGGNDAVVSQLTKSASLSIFEFLTPAQIADVLSGAASIDLSTAIQAAVNSGETLRFPTGRYRADATIDVPVTARFHFDPGAIMVRGANVPFFRVTDGFDWIEPVTTVAKGSVALQDNTVDTGTEGTTTTYTDILTLSGARTIAKGDVVKVFSDDVQIGARPSGANRARKGEHAVVGLASSSTTITLTGPLRDAYATNVRVAKLKKSGRFIWDGFAQFDYDDTVAGAAAWTVEYVAFVACSFEVHGLRARRSRWPVGRAYGCHDFQVFGLHDVNGRNDGTSGQFGYGFDVRNSDFGLIDAPCAINTRHITTSNPEEVPTGSTDPWRYGKSRDITVRGGKGHGNSNAQFDTHEDAEDWYYSDCTSVNTYAGGRSNGTSYTSRGRRNSFYNCVSVNSRIGFWLTGYEDDLLDGCVVRGAWYTPIRIEQNGISAAYPQKRVTIRNCILEAEGPQAVNGALAVYGADTTGNDVELFLENVTLRMLGSGNSTKIIDLYATRLRFRGLTIDLRDWSNAAASLAIFSLLGTSGCDVRGTGLRILAGATVISSLVSSSSATTHTGRIEDIRIEANTDITASWMGNPFNISNNPGLLASGEKLIGSTLSRSRFVAQTASAAFNLGITQSADPEIFIDLAGSNGAVAGANWADVMGMGSIVSIANNSNGTVTWTVPPLSVAAGSRIRVMRTNSNLDATKWKQIG